MAYRIIAGLLGLLFAWAGYLQLNDVDPLLWGMVYIAACFFMFTAAAGKPKGGWALGYAVVAGVWAGYLAVSIATGDVRQMFPEAEKTGWLLVDTEEGREMGGLLIIAAALVYVWLARHKLTTPQRDVGMPADP